MKFNELTPVKQQEIIDKLIELEYEHFKTGNTYHKDYKNSISLNDFYFDNFTILKDSIMFLCDCVIWIYKDKIAIS